MVNNSYKNKVKAIIARAHEKGAVKSYSQFCQTETGRKSALTKEEVSYYTSKNKGEAK